MNRAYYSSTIQNFLTSSAEEILGYLAKNSQFSWEQTQSYAWKEEIKILKEILAHIDGSIYFEYSIPRMGSRIDVLLLIGPVIFVVEFKIGEKEFHSHDVDQVMDYALDLKNFHETSHDHFIVPILVATKSKNPTISIGLTPQNDKTFFPVCCNEEQIPEVLSNIIAFSEGNEINADIWEIGRYCPTPTIIEAAKALYKGHNVSEISRNDASAINLSKTTDAISEIIRTSKIRSQKAICFVTGVPGAGKTLVGLNIANKHYDKDNELYSVFLSGNGPLVNILREALARDRIDQAKLTEQKIKKYQALSEVKMFIQNVHHFRDDCLIDEDKPPIEHVALFDEAQRAWNIHQTSKFMRQKKGRPNFKISEPEFLISCLDRHRDWAVVVCLVGGGQEINTGEAGISEWIKAIIESYPDWHVYISPRLTDEEYASGEALEKVKSLPHVEYKDELHLAVSMRSFRAEHVSTLVKQILDKDIEDARETLDLVRDKYPIVITRDLKKAKTWLKEKARGSERYGIVVSSQAERLKPHAIDVKSPINPIHWFLNDKDDVRSSYYLEHVASEFHIQGLELDWVCITWDADFRPIKDGWDHWSFRGKEWTKIRKDERKIYLKNAYRVLLTRARQGMVIVVPEGSENDPTRNPKFYDPIFEYLTSIGFEVV